MQDYILKNRVYLLGAVVLLAAFLIFFNIAKADIQTDDAAYSLRAVGYFDFIDAVEESTPIQWFGSIPWWSRLSFHDAPPLVFLIQFIFFKLFGESVFIARLPFALAGVASIILIYLIGKRLYGVQVGLLASLVLTVGTYHTWASRVGYLEPIALFFILLTVLWFLKSLEDHKQFIWFGIFLGLMLLTKYSALFVLPVLFVYLILKDKKIFTSRYFLLSLVLAGMLFSPVIVYNTMLQITRGHLDLQLAQGLGQDISDDWPYFNNGISGFQISQMVTVLKEFRMLFSLPSIALMVISLLYISGRWVLRPKDSPHFLLLLLLFFLFLEFSYIGTATRFMSLFNPFIALVIAAALVDFSHYFAKVTPGQKIIAYCFWGGVVILFSIELFYNINTNHYFKHFGTVNQHYSEISWKQAGAFNQLTAYLVEQGAFNNLEPRVLQTAEDIKIDLARDLVGKDLYIYDIDLNWFSTLWYFRRWSLYHQGAYFLSAGDLIKLLPGINFVELFREKGISNFHFIAAKDPSVLSASSPPENRTAMARLIKALEQYEHRKHDIKDYTNTTVFVVYTIPLNSN